MALSARQLDKTALDLVEQRRRQRAEIATLIVDRPNVRPWPNKAIAFRYDDP
ncbi:hypothetical protein GGI64_001808 [Rhizobium leguminosarum]|uniref:Uncharacterized protein n=1 Tax=Rhizobium leguminosarum TaxID=384 RepID=A0A7Z0IXG7_RHILE|nr:hypothetical protein [Rhizobium leguminosarum]NYJ10761.1 hypothetical protein [Rhizobium leguminosarum]